jgi:diacylglycerol kinase family enzyme
MDGSATIYSADQSNFMVIDSSKGKEPRIIRIDDIYAVFRNGAELRIESCPRKVPRKLSSRNSISKPKNPYQRTSLSSTVELSTEEEATEWHSYIKKQITPGYSRPLSINGPNRKLLVVVNPIGGKRKGEEIYHEILKPMIMDNGTDHEVIITTGPGHAERIAETFDLNTIGAVAIVGGDGLFGEFINGMNNRPDRLVAHSIPLGVVPAGSSNCLACSVGLRQPLAAAFAIVKGKVKPLDVLKVTLAGEDSINPTPRVILSVCGVSYGFISEVNTHASKWRRLFGPARYAICGFRTLFASPMEYHVDCRFLPPIDDPDPQFDKTECGPDCELCEQAAHVKRKSGMLDDPVSPMSPEPGYIGRSLEMADEAPKVDDGWVDSSISMEPRRKSLEPKALSVDNSTMLLFSVTNLSIRQSQNYTVWNPNSHMASGFMDLVLMPVISRVQLLKFYSKYNRGGSYHKEDANVFSIVKARSVEMRITNFDALPAWEKQIKIAIDGETHPLQPLRVDTLHGFLNFICS